MEGTTIAVKREDHQTLKIEAQRLGLKTFDGRVAPGLVVRQMCQSLRRMHRELGLVPPEEETK